MTQQERRDNLRRVWQLLYVEGACIELRAPKAGRYGTLSGYFDDEEAFIKAALEWSGKTPGLYVTLNEPDPRLLARYYNRMQERAEHTTADKDIRRRHWLPLDFDVERPTGISSTEGEHSCALARASECRAWLQERYQIDGVFADSGNGGHLLLPIDLPNDEVSKSLCERFLKALAYVFDDEAIHVDCSMFNAARICKLYGTIAGKGDSTPDRPHRDARLLDIPDSLAPVPVSTLQAIAALLPEEEKPVRKTQGPTVRSSGFDVRAYLEEHGLSVKREKTWQGGTCLQLEACPFNPDHSAPDSAVFFWPSGVIRFRCLHNSCEGKGWTDVRELFEPGYRERRGNQASERSAPSTKHRGDDKTQTSEEVLPENPFAVGAMRADLLPDALPPVRLWFGFYPRSVVLIIGETGAGKSSLLYNFAIHAAHNQPLWEIEFGQGRPLRVLYIDPENSGNFNEGQGGQCAVKIERIDAGKPKDLVFHTGQGVNLSNSEHMEALRQYIVSEHFDLVILDPIANLFQTRDENDNAEAARQMTTLTALSRETGACIVPVHHTGKDSQGNYGRGASARLAAADVAFVFRCQGGDSEQDDTYSGELRERKDMCRLQIVKNRLEGRGSLYLQMDGQDRFARCTFEEWKRGAKPDESKTSQAREQILGYIEDEEWYSRNVILQAMGKMKLGRDAVDAALDELTKEGKIKSEKRGRGGALHFMIVVSEEEADTSETFLFSGSPIGNQESRKVQDDDEREEGEIE